MTKFKNFWKDFNADKMNDYMTTLGIRMKQKAVGTEYAGEIPNSLLAEQDLETSKAQKMITVHYISSGGKDMTRTMSESAYRQFISTVGDQIKIISTSEEENKSMATFAVWYYDKRGNQQCAIYNNQLDADAFVDDLKMIGYTKIEMVTKTVKGVVEQTGKKLDEEAEKAKDADTKEEVKSVVDSIKAVQIKRQTATIQAREKAMGKNKSSFKDAWNGLKK